MKILHILNDERSPLSTENIGIQSKDHEVKVIELFQGNIPYKTIIDEILSHDRLYPGNTHLDYCAMKTQLMPDISTGFTLETVVPVSDRYPASAELSRYFHIP